MNQYTAIEKLLLVFLEELINLEKVDLIVCCERKGSGILRALIEELPPPNLDWPWDRVVSTTALSQFDWSKFDGKRILLFDELVHHGRTLERHKKKVLQFAAQGTEVITASYAVWDRCVNPPDYAYYRTVDTETYEQVREEVVSMLQRYGSLLLDTEHIELSIRLQCGVRDFYNELARAAASGNTFSFVSGLGRTNLTINDPDIVSEKDLSRYLTPGSNLHNSIRKCRILERHHDVFSLTPIIYPNTHSVTSKEWMENLPDFIFRDRIKNSEPKDLFFIIGLLTSIELLKGVVSSLSELISDNKIILETPEENFYHLKATFPNIDVHGLCNYVRDAVSKSRRKKARRSRGYVSAGNVKGDRLLSLSARTMCRLIDEVDDHDPNSRFPKGKSWYEILQLVKDSNRDLNPTDSEAKIVPDRLIDGGLLVTTADEVVSAKGEVWVIRTYSPAGEGVSDKIRRQMMIRGSHWLPVT